MKPAKKYTMDQIELNARRWNDSYGNTYFSLEIYIDDALFHRNCFQYGYGNHYEHVAAKYIRLNYTPEQLPKEFLISPSRWCRENNIKFVSNVSDVNRKRDLHGEGKEKNNTL